MDSKDNLMDTLSGFIEHANMVFEKTTKDVNDIINNSNMTKEEALKFQKDFNDSIPSETIDEIRSKMAKIKNSI